MDKNRIEDISLIGMELFKKNNESYLKSKLSPIMNKIFMVANKDFEINTNEEVYYMKSGSLPNRVYYIYSDSLLENAPRKLYDIVIFNGELCVWFYCKNVIQKMESEPVNTSYDIYRVLIDTFTPFSIHLQNNFANYEYSILRIVMTLNLIKFIHEIYGVLDLEQCKNDMISYLCRDYEEESIPLFIDSVLNNCDDKMYFKNRDYLTDSLLLKEKICTPEPDTI